MRVREKDKRTDQNEKRRQKDTNQHTQSIKQTFKRLNETKPARPSVATTERTTTKASTFPQTQPKATMRRQSFPSVGRQLVWLVSLLLAVMQTSPVLVHAIEHNGVLTRQEAAVKHASNDGHRASIRRSPPKGSGVSSGSLRRLK